MLIWVINNKQNLENDFVEWIVWTLNFLIDFTLISPFYINFLNVLYIKIKTWWTILRYISIIKIEFGYESKNKNSNINIVINLFKYDKNNRPLLFFKIFF